MYGTVAHMKVKEGKVDELLAVMREDQRRPKGFVSAHVYRLDDEPDQLILAVLFEDRESYAANADDPEQDAWYRKMRAHLEADPHWHDGEIVYSM